MTATVASAPACGDDAAVTARHRPAVAWSLVALALPALIGAARLLATVRRPFEHGGDEAIFEAAIRHVASGTQALGPYSRFGFNQPGPAYFDAQAPFYWLTGTSPRALFLGALCINLGCALASVLVIRRFLGERPARWGAVVVGAYLLLLTPRLLADPWPVLVLGPPFLLTMLLAAAAATGSVAAAGGALVGGSYLVQTHIATAATVVVVLTAAGAVAVITRLRRPTREERHRLGRARIIAGMVAVTVAFGLLWVPPLVEEFTTTPGNLTELTEFFRQSHPDVDAGVDHSLERTARQVTRQLSIFPLGIRAEQNSNRPIEPAGVPGAAVVGGGLIASAGVFAAGRRRRDRFLMALGTMSLAGTAIAIWSAMNVVGIVYPYLFLWTSALLVPAWIAAGVLMTARLDGVWPQIGSRVLAGALIAVTATSSWAMVRAPLPPRTTNTDVTAAAGIARPWLASHAVDEVRVRLGDHGQWPLAAGLINILDREGWEVTADDDYTPLFGDQFAPTGREDTAVWLMPADRTPAEGERVDRLGGMAGWVVWAGPLRRS